MAGQWLFGTGEAMIVAAHLGNSPWTVFAQGTAVRTGLSIGLMTNLIGALVLLLWIPLRQRPGLGTVANVLLVGTALDVTLHWLPDLTVLAGRVGLCVGGILVVAVGSGIYLSTGLGPGPRDGLMTGIARVSGWPLGAARGAVEATVLIAGWLLGGVAGIGTLLFAAFIGPCVHLAVRLVGRIPYSDI
ncbi:YitT family protein [Mycobacterium sp. SA01]|uniref:membrane protein YczE n=1 Tax=Mycobacterium sp. SA01 TaxID=3238820 RepID=UPI00351BD209